MKIALGCDHAGFLFKKEVELMLLQSGYEVRDVGCDSEDSVDYPDFADKVCTEIKTKHCERGILICGTGLGMSMAANRHHNIRAALCQESFSAKMSRLHNDANVLCLGSRVVGLALALDLVNVWLETEFAGGRHQQRLIKMG